MTKYQGFKTKKEAQEFQKKNKKGLLWHKGEEGHRDCVIFGGLDGTKYPWVVTWHI